MLGWTRWVRAALLVLQEEGARGVARYTVRRAYARQRYFVYEKRLAPDEAVALPEGLTCVRQATAAERGALVHAREDFDTASYWEVIQPHAVCYVGLDGYRIVSVHWLSAVEEPNMLVELGVGDFVIGPCVTAPSHRGRGVYPAMIRALCAARYAQGDRRAFMVVSVRNHSSIRGIEKAGFRRVAAADLHRMAGLQRIVRRALPEAA